jgi:hypothetical protein
LSRKSAIRSLASPCRLSEETFCPSIERRENSTACNGALIVRRAVSAALESGSITTAERVAAATALRLFKNILFSFSPLPKASTLLIVGRGDSSTD